MKSRLILLMLSMALLSSCIVKSLQPFYIKKSLAFNDQLLGSWTDNKNGSWQVVAFVDAFNEERDMDKPLSEDDKKALENYKEGYLVNYIKKEKEAGFIAMPFRIEDEYYIDFTPIQFEEEDINDLAVQHLIKTHTVAKVEFNEDRIQLSWLSEEPIKKLYETERMRLKYEKVGFDETLLLTATSNELYEFLRKYRKAEVDDKWTKDQLTLQRTDAKP